MYKRMAKSSCWFIHGTRDIQSSQYSEKLLSGTILKLNPSIFMMMLLTGENKFPALCYNKLNCDCYLDSFYHLLSYYASATVFFYVLLNCRNFV